MFYLFLFQIPVWEFFTATKIFKNYLNKNFEVLSDDDALDIHEIVTAARKKFETDSINKIEFVRLRSGYRKFCALRGIEYIVDLEYRIISNEKIVYANKDNIILQRMHLCRPIFSTNLVPVCYLFYLIFF